MGIDVAFGFTVDKTDGVGVYGSVGLKAGLDVSVGVEAGEAVSSERFNGKASETCGGGGFGFSGGACVSLASNGQGGAFAGLKGQGSFAATPATASGGVSLTRNVPIGRFVSSMWNGLGRIANAIMDPNPRSR